MSVVISENEQLFSHKDPLFESVNFIGIINKLGRITDTFGFDSIDMPKDKKEVFFMKIALRNSMQKDFDDYLGTVNYCLTLRENAKYISIPISDNKTVLVVTKKDIDHEKVIDRINQIIHSKQILKEEFQERNKTNE